MDVQSFAQALFTRGRTMGFRDMEVYASSRNQFRVGVFKTEIDSYTLAESRGLMFRGLINGKMGYSFTENFADEGLETLLKDALENAAIMDGDAGEEIFAGAAPDNYTHIDAFSESLPEVPAGEKIAWVKAVEGQAYALDNRVFTAQVSVGDTFGETLIMNSHGLKLSHRDNFAAGYISAVVKEGADTKQSYAFVAARDFTRFDAAKLAKEAVEEALSLLGAEPVPSGSYPVVLRKDVALTFLSTFASSFSADAAQKGMSLLKGKVNERIMSEIVTIIDDPHLAERPNASPFDAEGFPTRKKAVVEGGVLTTLLHNQKTAKKEGVMSTGNAHKAAYNAPVGVAHSNFYIVPGQNCYQALLTQMGDGLIITSIQGTHAGANPVSGDFSLSAYGYLVKGGQVVRPVNQITIAGNFFTMLSDVRAVGDDLDFGVGAIGAPSLFIGSLAVAGT
ncbi:MAG: Metalloprotease PmbA [Firmicutes bacterium]|nr:Metalloprotease PmbA [candidate division NPL-UPA2 bacterium]